MERAVREDAERNPRNPRMLFLESEALARAKENEKAAAARRQFMDAWKDADVELKLEDF
jgi:hypothetical protein